MKALAVFVSAAALGAAVSASAWDRPRTSGW